MDILNNLNKNIFGENHKHDSNSIDFTAKPKQDKNQKILDTKNNKSSASKQNNDKPKPFSSNNLLEIKKDKPKTTNAKKDGLSYTINKNALKNISDPLSQLRPDANFGYPKKKEKNDKPKETKVEKEEETKEEKKEEKTNKDNVQDNNINIGDQKTKAAVMTGLFGDFSNININKNPKGNNNANINPLLMNQNALNNNNNMNANLIYNQNLINLMHMQMQMNQMNQINQMNQMKNMNQINQQNLLLNLYKSKSDNNLNQKLNQKTIQNSLPLTKKPSNTDRNELGQVYKPGDLYSDTKLIREKLGIMKAENLKDISKATLNVPDKKFIGVLVLTDFRLIFHIENPKNLNNNYSEDYFKIPLFSIAKIEKVQDKKMAFDAIPIEITLKDTRVIKFHLFDLQRFYYNLSDATNPVDYGQFYGFPKYYNEANFKGKNLTNGWNIYDPVIEFSRQGVTEDNNLGLRYSRVNENFKICPTYPEFLIEPKNITDEQLKQSSSYRTKGRLPIFTYYYSGNASTNPKVTPSIWRSAQNKRGLMGNKTCEADVSLLNSISRLGGPDGKLYIFDCRPKLNAFVNRVGGGGYEKEKDYDNATLTFCEIDNIHKARKALNSLYSLCLSNKINDYNNFWTNLEQTGWFQFIYLMLKNANEISKTLQNNHSVLIHCSDGWDRTAQLSSLSQLLLDPFYRTINGFAVLVEKDWLSFGHQFGLRNGFSDKDKQDQASPIFLQFLDAVHQLIEQFPNAFEFNEKFLLFLAKTYRVNLYGTFMFNNDKERKERNAKVETASVWTEIFCDLQPYLNVYYDPKSAKILEPNYSYYNLKLWTALFMENNIFLENKHFSVGEADKNITFKTKQEFFAYKKKEDENKYMNYQLKYDELFRAMAESYYFIKDEKNIFDNLSLESKNLIYSLKSEMDKINKNRLMKKEIIDKSLIKKEEKKEIPKEIFEQKKEVIKDETQKLKKPNIKETPKKETKAVNKPKKEPNKEKKEEVKEEKKQETKEEKKEENKEEEKSEEKKEETTVEEKKEEKKEESNEEKKEEEKVEEKKEKTSEEKKEETNVEETNEEKKEEETKEEKKEETNEEKKEEIKKEEKNEEKKEEDLKDKENESSDTNNEKKEEVKPEEKKEDDNNKEIEGGEKKEE